MMVGEPKWPCKGPSLAEKAEVIKGVRGGGAQMA